MQTPHYKTHQVTCRRDPSGTLFLHSELSIGPVARHTGEWLQYWAQTAPDRIFLKERSGAGWREISYLETLQQVQAVASALLARGMGPGTPIIVLSGPGIDHGVLMLAAHTIGAPIAPLAEQYSLIPEAAARLDYCIDKIGPALVYAHDGERFHRALNSASLAKVAKLVSAQVPATASRFDDALRHNIDASLDGIRARVGPETLAKILFTSGSTGNPKGVPQTQRMLTVNQAQYLACMPLLAARPPVIVDWLPWNHVFAGNANFNLILCNGGTLIIDDGKPVPGLFERTLENLSMQRGTISLNVPIAYSMLVAAMRRDVSLKRRFFEDLDMILYAGASLPEELWGALEQMACEVSGSIPMMTSCWGLTETAPSCLLHYQGGARPGMIGVPVPELSVKLVPCQPERYEIRVKGPNVITAYFDAPEKDAESFDEDGYFITHDAVRFADADKPTEGLLFDGRLSEDFKLLSGVWVQAASIRLLALDCLQGLVQDVVVTGADRSDIGLLIFALPARARVNDGQTVTDEPYCRQIVEQLQTLGSTSGSSHRIARALIMSRPPSIEDAEVTAKGSLNYSAITRCRADLLARLYDDQDSACLILST